MKRRDWLALLIILHALAATVPATAAACPHAPAPRLRPGSIAIVAPGVDVFSSLPLNSYGSNSGTSMAGPHLVGVVALIWSAQPDLIGDIDATEQLIIDTASPYRGNTSLGCFSGDDPSNAYGYGVVNVYEAVKQALGK